MNHGDRAGMSGVICWAVGMGTHTQWLSLLGIAFLVWAYAIERAENRKRPLVPPDRKGSQ